MADAADVVNAADAADSADTAAGGDTMGAIISGDVAASCVCDAEELSGRITIGNADFSNLSASFSVLGRSFRLRLSTGLIAVSSVEGSSFRTCWVVLLLVVCIFVC